VGIWTDFKKRVPASRCPITACSIKTQTDGFQAASSPTGGKCPELSLDVVKEDAVLPCKRSWNNHAYAFAAAGRTYDYNVPFTVITEQLDLAESRDGSNHYSSVSQQSRLPNFVLCRPMCGAMVTRLLTGLR